MSRVPSFRRACWSRPLALLLSTQLCGLLLLFITLNSMGTNSWATVQDPSRPTSSMYGVSQREYTRAFLDAFPAALPGLRALWDGEDFCAWPGVLCTLQGVHVDVSAHRLSGRLPELSDSVDGSMVVLLSINLSANRDLRGTLPVSWGELDTVAYINVASTGLSGTIPRAWYSMDALKELNTDSTRISTAALTLNE